LPEHKRLLRCEFHFYAAHAAAKDLEQHLIVVEEVKPRYRCSRSSTESEIFDNAFSVLEWDHRSMNTG
jgi:hypothetical protein